MRFTLTDRMLVEKSGTKTVPPSPLNIIATVLKITETPRRFEVENEQSIEGEICNTMLSVVQMVDTGYQVIFSNNSSWMYSACAQ